MADRRTIKPQGAGKPSRINRILRESARKDYSQLTNLVLVTNRGLNREQTGELRTELRTKGIRMRVVRSRITALAFQELGLKDAKKLFNGPTAIIEAADPVIAAKTAIEFCRKFEKKMAITGGVLEGRILNAQEVQALAASKSKPELLGDVAQLALSPGRRLAAQLLSPAGRIAGALKALAEKLEKAGQPTPEAAG